ncbi:MAG: response regulator [Proteobacteria bacterium]|nr:MAG: response regulator [Pseudomonadota bacterium]
MAKTILIVDDIPFVRKTLTEIAIELGYKIAGEAADGVEAIERYAALKPDLVTMDIVMPKLSGIEATRQIMNAFKDAVVVMVTGMDQETLVMEAIQAGARDIIHKPFNAVQIAQVFERALKKEHSAHAGAKTGS